MPGKSLGGVVARIGSWAVVDTWAEGFCIHLPGQDRRVNLGALPGVHTAGFHASRFALASQNPGAHRNLRTPCYLQYYHYLHSLSTPFA